MQHAWDTGNDNETQEIAKFAKLSTECNQFNIVSRESHYEGLPLTHSQWCIWLTNNYYRLTINNNRQCMNQYTWMLQEQQQQWLEWWPQMLYQSDDESANITWIVAELIGQYCTLWCILQTNKLGMELKVLNHGTTQCTMTIL